MKTRVEDGAVKFELYDDGGEQTTHVWILKSIYDVLCKFIVSSNSCGLELNSNGKNAVGTV